MTKAEIWRAMKPQTFTSFDAYFDLLEQVDPDGYTKLIDDKAHIVFSDGSTHCMHSSPDQVEGSHT